jgi:alanyl-tRNA synthetase
MGNYFHELIEQKEVVENVISNEESAFSKTLDRGISIFNDICKKSSTSIAGEDAFLLYDTYGFPLDLIQLMASERNMTVNVDKFDVCMDNQRAMARCSQKKSVIEISDVSSQKTNFVGYDLKNIGSFKSTLTSVIRHDDRCFLTFSETVFYAECGGQVGDHGTVKVGDKIFKIVDVQKDKNGCYLHEVDGDVDEKMIGEHVVLSVDKNFRRNVSRNHSATHILQYALRSVLGTQVKQAGSYVDDKRLRFDFNAISAPTVEELNEIETIVLKKILECEKANVYETTIENIPDGCLANFGEKYGDIVRVVEIGDFSKELCGGCHVENTSEKGLEFNFVKSMLKDQKNMCY